MHRTVATSDGPMRLYEARPEGEPRGAVVVVPEAFGVDPHIEHVTRRAAAAGHPAAAPGDAGDRAISWIDAHRT